jgi:hypothetical protein
MFILFYSFNLIEINILEIAHKLTLGILDYSKKSMLLVANKEDFMANEIPCLLRDTLCERTT